MKNKPARHSIQTPEPVINDYSDAHTAHGNLFEQPAGRPTSKALYLQVKEHLIRRVLAGEWRPGACLPSEMKLAEGYELSQGTVRKAIEEMAVEGLVTRHPGRGTFVSTHREDNQSSRFRRFYSNEGARIAGSDSIYISCQKANADAQTAAFLKISTNSEVAKIVRVRHLKGQPVLLETIMLNRDLCPEAELMFEQKKPSSIYLALEQTYHILITKVVERLRARTASQDEQELLGLAPNSPVLEVKRLSYSLGCECVEYRIFVCGSNDIHYWNEAG